MLDSQFTVCLSRIHPWMYVEVGQKRRRRKNVYHHQENGFKVRCERKSERKAQNVVSRLQQLRLTEATQSPGMKRKRYGDCMWADGAKLRKEKKRERAKELDTGGTGLVFVINLICNDIKKIYIISHITNSLYKQLLDHLPTP